MGNLRARGASWELMSGPGCLCARRSGCQRGEPRRGALAAFLAAAVPRPQEAKEPGPVGLQALELPNSAQM